MQNVQAITIRTPGRTITAHAVVDDSVHALGPFRVWSLRGSPHTVVVTGDDGSEQTAEIRDVDAALRRAIWLGAMVIAVLIRILLRGRQTT